MPTRFVDLANFINFIWKYQESNFYLYTTQFLLAFFSYQNGEISAENLTLTGNTKEINFFDRVSIYSLNYDGLVLTAEKCLYNIMGALS